MRERIWRVELLGGLRATGAGQVIARFPTRKAASLLAYLAYFRHREHPRDLLAETLWPETETETARNRFRVVLSSLRQLLEPADIEPGAVLCRDRQFVQINPEAVTTDVAEFEEALRLADQ